MGLYTFCLRTVVFISFLSTSLWPDVGLAQKPGKERIELQFPKDVKWKSTKNKKDTPSIRGFTWTPQLEKEGTYPVLKVEILTIDKRYYPLSAKDNVDEKWNYRQSLCSGSTLDVHYQNQDEKGLMIVYILRNPPESQEGLDKKCDPPIWILLAAEGPTAFHSVEVQIPETEYTTELVQSWVEILKNRILK